jgi:hypothetical protein
MNLKHLTQTFSNLYILSRQNSRRKVEYRRIGRTEVIMEIYLELKLLQFSGETYWNHSKVVDGLYRRTGFPCRGDDKAKELYEDALKYVESKFVPMPGRRQNYSFALVEDQTGVTAKFLSH